MKEIKVIDFSDQDRMISLTEDKQEYYKVLFRFIDINDIVNESDINNSKPVLERDLLCTWTDNAEEASMTASELNNSYVFLWCTPHKSFEDFKKWFIEREKLLEVDGGYRMPIPEFEYWNPSTGYKRGEENYDN